MKRRARRQRAMLRYRRRGYGPEHALLCRCPECVDYGVPARELTPLGLIDYEAYLMYVYLGGRVHPSWQP